MIRSLPMVPLSKSVAVLLCFLLLVIPALVGMPCATAQCEQAQDCCCHGMHMAMDTAMNTEADVDQASGLSQQMFAEQTSLPSVPECECGAAQQSADSEQVSDVHNSPLALASTPVQVIFIPAFVSARQSQISPPQSRCNNTQASLCTFQI